MTERERRTREVKDQKGWSHGIKAAFRTLYGTDTEVRIRTGGLSADIAHAQKQVGKMSQGAQELLESMDEEKAEENGNGMEHIFDTLLKRLF